MKVRVFHSDTEVRIVGAGSVLFAVWTVVPTMDLMRVLERAGDEHRDSLRKQKQAMVNVAIDGIPNFSDEVRAEAARHSRRSAPWRLATAHVIEFSGLRGIAVRSFMSTMLLLGRPQVPTKVFDKVEAAAPWLVPYLPTGDEWTRERFLWVYEMARGAAPLVAQI